MKSQKKKKKKRNLKTNEISKKWNQKISEHNQCQCQIMSGSS